MVTKQKKIKSVGIIHFFVNYNIKNLVYVKESQQKKSLPSILQFLRRKDTIKIMNNIPRKEQDKKDCWNLDSLYKNKELFYKDFKIAKDKIKELSSLKGTLDKSPANLFKVINSYINNLRLIEKLYTFSHLKSDEDTTNSHNLGSFQEVSTLYAEFNATSSFISPELLKMDTKTIESYINEEPKLKEFKRFIFEIIRFKPHVLTEREEKIIASGVEVYAASSQIFSQLNNADLEFGEVLINGEKKALTNNSYTLFLKHKDQNTRKEVFNKFYKVFDSHKNTLSATLSSSIKKDVYISSIKKYNSCLHMATFSDDVGIKVYNNLIENVSEGLSHLHRYYALRKDLLKLKKQNIFDTYTPLVKNIKTNFSFDESVNIVLDALSPLGKEYQKILLKGLKEQRWVDKYENKGKRQGGYSSGCYDSFPFILMNYKEESLDDMFTLAHEAGHSMHSYFSRKNQPYQDSHYTIFVAEVASTFNEQLLNIELKKRYFKDKDFSAYLINKQIDDIKATFFRQTMFAEFEKKTHEIAEKGGALTVDSFKEIYKELLIKYFGNSVEINDFDSLECLRIPHFYSPFYVYKYATGIEASISLLKGVIEEKENKKEDYLNFLKSGGSLPPLDLLKNAGVDLTKKEPVEETISLFSHLIDKLEEILG